MLDAAILRALFVECFSISNFDEEKRISWRRVIIVCVLPVVTGVVYSFFGPVPEQSFLGNALALAAVWCAILLSVLAIVHSLIGQSKKKFSSHGLIDQKLRDAWKIQVQFLKDIQAHAAFVVTLVVFSSPIMFIVSSFELSPAIQRTAAGIFISLSIIVTAMSIQIVLDVYMALLSRTDQMVD